MFKKNLILSLVILAIGLVLSIQILMIDTTEAVSDGHEEPTDTAKPPKGPHRGRLLTDKDLQLEAHIYETGIPPEFHIYFYQQNQVIPFSEVKLKARVIRLGQTDQITFKPEADYWRSEQVIAEPHSFDVIFEGVYKQQRYTWKFTQEEGRLKIPPALIKRSEIEILKAGPQTLQSKLRFPGQIALDQDKYVHISPPVAGRAIEVYKHVGEPVAKGELLAIIHSRELADLRLEQQLLTQKSQRERLLYQRAAVLSHNTRKLLGLLKQGQDPESIHRKMMKSPVGENKAVLLSAFANLRLAGQTLKRETDLKQDKLNSEETYQMAKTAYDNALSKYIATIEEAMWQRNNNLIEHRQAVQAAQAEKRAAEQKLQVLQVPIAGQGVAAARYELRSPISGVVSDKHLAIGEIVSPDQPIFEIANLSVVWAELHIPATALNHIRSGQMVRVMSQDGQREAIGHISHVSPVVEAESRRSEAHAHIHNSDGFWRPGMFVTVEVTTAEQRVPVAVSKEALQSYNDWTVVYAKYGDLFEIRPLELGVEDGRWVEVKSGIKPGQLYAAANSFIIKAELGKKAATHDH